MNFSLLNFSSDDYLVPPLPVDIPFCDCRAIICDVIVEERETPIGRKNIDIVFFVVASSFFEPYVYEKHLECWQNEGGIESVFEGLITDDEVQDFHDLVGAVFDACIEHHASEGKNSSELLLKKLVALPSNET